MPMVMLGTGYMAGYMGRNQDQTAELNVQKWLAAGGRGIDTAWFYKCQNGIGSAIKASGVARSEIFILSKVPGTNGYDQTTDYVNQNLQQLGTTYIDLVLLHWCGGPTGQGSCDKSKIGDSWRALEDLQKNGSLKSIGISNFCEDQIQTLLKSATITPAVQQIERHPKLLRTSLAAATKKAGITVQAYGPLGDPDRCAAGKALMKDRTVQKIATAHSVSPAQVLLRWSTQQGYPLSVRVEKGDEGHMKENLAVMNSPFTLSSSEISELNGISAAATCWPSHCSN